jgi:hypothetical protein
VPHPVGRVLTSALSRGMLRLAMLASNPAVGACLSLWPGGCVIDGPARDSEATRPHPRLDERSGPSLGQAAGTRNRASMARVAFRPPVRSWDFSALHAGLSITGTTGWMHSRLSTGTETSFGFTAAACPCPIRILCLWSHEPMPGASISPSAVSTGIQSGLGHGKGTVGRPQCWPISLKGTNFISCVRSPNSGLVSWSISY